MVVVVVGGGLGQAGTGGGAYVAWWAYAEFLKTSMLKSVSSSPNGSDMRTAIDWRPIIIPEMTAKTASEIPRLQRLWSRSSTSSTSEYETMLSEESRSSLVAWKSERTGTYTGGETSEPEAVTEAERQRGAPHWLTHTQVLDPWRHSTSTHSKYYSGLKLKFA